MIDDAGFGSSSAFGGPCDTPNMEKLATGGLKYTRFHTTALCSPTRSALLCGRNHHSVGMGAITEMATSAPGNSSIRPKNKAPLAEILKLNGFSTAQIGKCHEVPIWEASPLGPFTQWPTGSGFEYFYGFVGGEANQYYPGPYLGTNAIEPTKTPEEGYTLNDDLANHAITWIHQQKALMPDKPFFLYYAPGATHAPHHVPKEWSDKYKGKFDAGWDKLREETFEQQKKLGVIPKDATLTKRHAEIPGWDEIDAALKPVLARQMEIYAGFMEQTDHCIGRVIDAVKELGIMDDTLIYLIIGDNGASAKGTINGCLLVRGNKQILYDGMRVAEGAILMMKNKSHTVSAELEVNGAPAQGVIVTQGGEAGGWVLYVKDGRLKYCYNFFGINHYIVEATQPIPSGTHEVRMEFKYDGGGLAKGGDVTLFYDNNQVGKGRVEKTQPMGYSADEACDVGLDTGSPTSPEYGSTGNKFNGDIHWVKLEVGDDSQDHLVTAEDRLNVAMAKQ